MRHTLLIFAASVALTAGTFSATPALAEGEYVPGEVIVVYEETAAPAEQTDAELADRGYEVTKQIEPTPTATTAPSATETIAVAETPADVSVEQAVAEVSSLEGVAYAQPNYVYRAVDPVSATSTAAVDLNDTYFKNNRLLNLELSSIRNAWELVQANGRVSVAVIDTGCRINHEDLTDNVNWLYAWDFLTNTENGGQRLDTSVSNDSSDSGDGNGHGTHVCGIVAARANNGKGVAGASYNAQIIPMRVLDASGNGSTDTVARALKKVLALKTDKDDPVNIRVVNLSLGGNGTDPTLNKLIADLAKEGVLCVCAAGNESSSGDFTPADAPDALSVMAVDKNKAHTYYTNYKTGGQINTSKTVSAMGGGGSGTNDWVWSTYDSGNSSYIGVSGTSQATPLVAGTAALMFVANPNLSSADAIEVLTQTADRDSINSNGSYAYKDAASAGLVNAYQAVAAAQNVSLQSVALPTVVGVEDLVYTGMPQTGVTANEGYTLTTVPFDPQKDDESQVSSASMVEGAKETNAGYYRTTAHLVTGNQWEDGTTADKVMEWSIERAPLTATYTGGSYKVGEVVSTNVTVTGFVNNETAKTAAGYVAPTLDLAGAADANGKAQLPDGEDLHVYEPTLEGGKADNYRFDYEQEYITVTRLKPVYTPQVPEGLTYTGREQAGVPEGDEYTVVGGRQTNAGTYEAAVSLKDPATHSWEDGTTEDKVISWTIAPAKLTLRYNGNKIMAAENTVSVVSNIVGNIAITGFVNGESAASLVAKGFVAPGLIQIDGNVSPAGTAAVVSSQDVSAAADPYVLKPMDADTTNVPGAKTLIPICKGLEEVDPGKAGDPTSNYVFAEGVSGTLDVYGYATAPTKADFTYDDQAHQGVQGGTHCLVTGTSVATAAGTYTVKATPDDHYIWSDKTLDDSDKDVSRTYEWKISAASIESASVLNIGNVIYTGKAMTPVPTVRVGMRTLVKDTDFTVAYRNNVNIGTATVVITSKGNYTGSKSVNFEIALAKVFTDVSHGSWYYDVVYRAAGLGFVNGYNDGRFGPDDSITRGQVVVVLWNMAGKPAPKGISKAFPDVTTGKYYYDAVRWASSVGVVNGYDTGRFGPENLITREQLSAMLANYTRVVADKDTSGSAADYANMKDAAKVTSWAARSVGWCFKNKIVSGMKDGNFNPQGNASRAETSKMVVLLYDLL